MFTLSLSAPNEDGGSASSVAATSSTVAVSTGDAKIGGVDAGMTGTAPITTSTAEVTRFFFFKAKSQGGGSPSRTNARFCACGCFFLFGAGAYGSTCSVIHVTLCCSFCTTMLLVGAVARFRRLAIRVTGKDILFASSGRVCVACRSAGFHRGAVRAASCASGKDILVG